MNGEDSRCQATTRMTGEGTSPAVSPSPSPAEIPASLPETSGSVSLGVDYYTQALKALSERSPFDSEEVRASTAATLPSSLASVLSKHSDSHHHHRKKHKRHYTDTKSASRKGSSSEKSKSSNIWTALEDYFRELTLPDIERLSRLSSSLGSLHSSDPCFTIPALGNFAVKLNDVKVENGHVENVIRVENVATAPAVVELKEEVKEEEVVVIDEVRVSESSAVELKEEVKEESNGMLEEESDAKLQEVIVEDESRDSSMGIVEQGVVEVSLSQSCSSIEWVLGSRNRSVLTSTRPSKKRKLSGESAGLKRLMVVQPCEGSSSLCHVCSMGDSGDQLNQLVVCHSCKVVVHQKCYGVQGEVDESWLCSWCKYKSSSGAAGSDRPCILCPKQGGACKRFQRTGGGNGGSQEFAHLFCSQWKSEIYIDDTRLMEPLLGVEGMSDAPGRSLCNLCKIKLGCCVRCSDGSCRTSFHPICAREARNKLEIWGKFGCDHIELRAFCSKHSGDSSVAGSGTLENEPSLLGSDPLAISSQQGNKIKKLKIGCRNGDKVTVLIGTTGANSNNSGEHETSLKDINANSKLDMGSEVPMFGELASPEQKLSEDLNTSHLDLGVLLKKILDQGKVSLEQIASEAGITEDSLATKLNGNHLSPEMSTKILKWLRDHAYRDSNEKDLRAKLRRLMPSKNELGINESSDTVPVRDLDMSIVVPVKSVPPRRRTVGNFSVLVEEEVKPLWNDKLVGNGVMVDEGTPQHMNGDYSPLCKDSPPDGIDKTIVQTNGHEHPLEEPSPTSESSLRKSNSPRDIERSGVEEANPSGNSSLMDLDPDPSCSSVNTAGYHDGDVKPGTDSYVHPYIQRKLEEVQSWQVQGARPELNEVKSFAMDQSSCGGISCGHNIDDGDSNGVKLEDLHKAKELGILELAPENEVEGEILFLQHRVLHNTVALKHNADQLVCKIARDLPLEMATVRKQRWDDVLVNQYIYELKEARKQGRKERRHQEAQAVLAAATAAAASSSRISSLRKDSVDEASPLENQMKVEGSRTRGSLSSLSTSRAKDSSSSLDSPRAMSDRYPDMFQISPGSPKEHLKSCDICRRPESLLNPIIVCLSCKVAVHMNCYRSVKESTGPWYCELCEASSSSKASRSTLYPIAECGLCGASNGAFRKSSNGQWVHAFCAEWVFDSTFRRGQVHPVAGMETVLKGNDVCSVCLRRFGVCIKCNYGNCQSTYHPSCARSAGYYMYTKYIGGGKMQHKAYCTKHSLEQRAKVENQKHGAEDLKIVKQHRVELEKLRLLCERIVKREKLKRELVLCNHDVLASKRDSLAFSMLVRRPFLLNEGSSESATTSLRGASMSCSEAMQRSDDVTVDSALSSKRCIRIPLYIDNDQKTDDSSTSQRIPTPKPAERASFAGKQIPIRAAKTSRNSSESLEMLKSRKNTETFEKELVMTSDQAFKRNRQLPKGYFYVPLDALSNGKQVNHDSVEREEVDG